MEIECITCDLFPADSTDNSRCSWFHNSIFSLVKWKKLNALSVAGKRSKCNLKEYKIAYGLKARNKAVKSKEGAEATTWWGGRGWGRGKE